MPEHADGALVGLPEAQDHVDRRRLAGAVGAEQRGDLAELEMQVDAIDGPDGAEGPMDAGELDGGRRTSYRCGPALRERQQGSLAKV